MTFFEVELYLHLILAVKGKRSFVPSEVKEKLEDYLREMVEINEHKIHAVSCMTDHAHFLISWNPNFSIDELVEEIKQLSKHFILHRKWTTSFNWQDEYVALSCSKSDVPKVIEYIHNQREYHKNTSFKEEFIGLLQLNEIEYREDDLIEFYD
jgi:putative transposase